MKHRYYPVLLLAPAIFAACMKDDDDEAIPAPTPVACGVDGMRLQGAIGSESFCANASLFADLSIVLTANGISQTGTSLTMELDSVDVGAHAASTDVNRVLYTDQLGLPWNSSNAAPATVHITSHDTTANRIQGSITGTLYAPAGSEGRTVNASFDLTYIE
ncbi:MAG: hypothetical protein IPL52_05650 [Flavobacteriales bacterium]|nr:hypothetical protein [Flavobacteriales bacterium]